MVTANAIALNCPVLGLEGCKAVEELIEQYGGRLCQLEQLGETLTGLWTGRLPALEKALLVDKIQRERSWMASARQLKELLQVLTRQVVDSSG